MYSLESEHDLKYINNLMLFEVKDSSCLNSLIEIQNEKMFLSYVLQAKTQISLHFWAVWSVCLKSLGSLAIQWAQSRDWSESRYEGWPILTSCRCHSLWFSYTVTQHVIITMYIQDLTHVVISHICLCWGFTAQSTQWGLVELGQFT